MKESSTYQAILEEGRIEGRTEGRTEGAVAEARKVLRLLGGEALGPPNSRTNAAIERLDDLVELEELLKRLWTATSWQDLFSQPASGSRGSRRKSSYLPSRSIS